MINFRFHIISLTAVFLAFAVGLVLGTTFLDDATKRALDRQLENLDDDLSAARTNNAELGAQIDRFDEESEGLDQQLGERLLPGTLADEPVLVIAPDGLEGEPVERVVETLAQADADYVGTWRLTERLVLDDEDEVEDLATALDVSTDDVERLRRNLTGDLATALFLAIHASDADPPPASPDGAASSEAAEPARIAALHEQGFLEYELPEDAESDVVLLPRSNLRVVVVTGAGAVVGNGQVLQPMLADLVSDGAAPVVVVAPTPVDEEAEDNVDGVNSLVAAVRDDDSLSEAISTVDDLELVSGRLAAVFALQRATPVDPVLGHYGLGPGAQELMPGL